MVYKADLDTAVRKYTRHGWDIPLSWLADPQYMQVGLRYMRLRKRTLTSCRKPPASFC